MLALFALVVLVRVEDLSTSIVNLSRAGVVLGIVGFGGAIGAAGAMILLAAPAFQPPTDARARLTAIVALASAYGVGLSGATAGGVAEAGPFAVGAVGFLAIGFVVGTAIIGSRTPVSEVQTELDAVSSDFQQVNRGRSPDRHPRPSSRAA